MQPIVKEEDVGYWYEEAVQQNHCREEGGSRHLCHGSELAGLILGAAAGMAFAALESSGYAFSAFLRSGGSLSLTVLGTFLRGLLSPVGHGPWTAILAGVLFRESAGGRFHINRTVMGTYLTVAILHGLWYGEDTWRHSCAFLLRGRCDHRAGIRGSRRAVPPREAMA